MKLNRQWILRQRPDDDIGSGDLEFVQTPIPQISVGQMLIRNLYLSLDPTNRLWMSDRDQYLPPVKLGHVMRGSTIGIVEQSLSEKFSPGDIVKLPDGGWQDYVVVRDHMAEAVVEDPTVPLTAHLSVLGMTGLTAYGCLLDIGRPQAGETVVISAAAGAVGSIAGQIAKRQGCHVIGIAGGPQKCRWLTEDLGFDAAIDYKSQDVPTQLDALCPNGIDVAFENVGGSIMDAIFSRLALHGRMAVCGLISGYNDSGPLAGPTDFGRILMKRLTVKGFIVIDYLDRSDAAFANLRQWIADGALIWKDHIIDGLENAPDALNLLFNGKNDGKLMVRMASE